MTAVDARYYDGKSSHQRDVVIHSEASGRLRVTGEGVEFECTKGEVRPSARVGNTRRHLYFADGSQCETDDNDGVDEMFAGVRAEGPGRLLHRWESHLTGVLGGIALTVALLWGGVVYGIPTLAKRIAFGLPAASEATLGQGALAGLDNALLEPTRLSLQRQSELRLLFSDMARSIAGAGDYRLELRASHRIGANALALPSGIVVVTDALVELARNDDELIAVLAHEIGHLRQHHDLRRSLQASAPGLLIIVLTGDMSAITSLAAVLPALLIESRYSRAFEREADDFAFDYLRRRGIATESFSDILMRMEERGGATGSVPDFLSSHPASRERAERFRSAP